ncbi:TPR repeat protein [Operophtera brumata]|uniref:TPR repeat protein n=1 Tax=Operophtera brumata TaxID=104452 RepID=A0A0L7L8A6_OPEBR|nr:TPR repeat protein [Operophtera brumata]
MSIDSFYEGLLAKLTKNGKILNISKHLLSLKTNEERVLYIHDVINENSSFPKVPEVHKSQNVSMYYRNLGNDCFQTSKHSKAWQYYNLALLHTPIKTEQYALALSNRSAVFFSMKMYKECIKDIDTIFSLVYPSRLKEKLLKRKSMCKEAIDEEIEFDFTGEGTEELLTMKDATDPRYQCASSKLQVVFNEVMGRHVVARDDIGVGEVLAQEYPYLVLLEKSQYLCCCNYCLSRDLNLFPCDKCCFALYCSEECKDKALKEYHGIECRLMPLLVHMEFTDLELLALRTTIRARTDHSDWTSFFKTIEEAEANANSEYRGHVKINDKWIFNSKYYPSIHTLASNIEKRSISDIFHKSVRAAVFLQVLTHETDFMKSDNDEELENIRKCVAGTLLLHVMTSPTNMHRLCSNMQTKECVVDEVTLASALYAFHSLLNHSCAPNVVRFRKLGSGKMTLPHHTMRDRLSRHAALKSQYKFDCICEACCNNWQTYNLLSPGKIPHILRRHSLGLIGPETIEKLQKRDKIFAYEQFKPLCELAEDLEPYAPCKELATCQEVLKQCLVILEGSVLYGYSQEVEWKAIPPKV